MELRIQQRRKANERKSEWLRDYLHINMTGMNLLDIKDNQIRLSIRTNPAKVIIENELTIPEEYKEQQITTLNRKSLIAEAIKLGKIIPGAVLRNGTRLQIS